MLGLGPTQFAPTPAFARPLIRMEVLPTALAQSIVAPQSMSLHADQVHCADGAVHGLALAIAAEPITLRTAPVAMLGGFAPLRRRYPHRPVGCAGSEWHRAKASTRPAVRDQQSQLRESARREIA